jgi:hypothetical protein
VYTEDDWANLKIDFKNYKSAQQAVYDKKHFLDSRISEIVAILARVFNSGQPLYWHWQMPEDDEGYETYHSIDYQLDNLPVNGDDPLRLDISGERMRVYYREDDRVHNWNYEEGFPARFLVMEDKDIEELLKEEVKQTAFHKENEKARRKVERNELSEKKAEFKRRLAVEKIRLREELGIKE